MNKKIIVLALVAGFGLSFGGGFWLGGGGDSGGDSGGASGAKNAESARKVLYWFDPMKQDVHFDKPGKSPFMDMDLVPRYADEDGGNGTSTTLKIDPSLTQNTGLKLAKVESAVFTNALDVQGSVNFNDREVSIIQARAAGILERVYPLSVGETVKAGQALAEIRVPDWFAAQSEFLALQNDPELASAARSRLLQLGMNQGQISTLEKNKRPIEVVTITSPREGMIATWDVREGMTIAAGQSLARINGLASIWVEASVPQMDAAFLRVGQTAKIELSALQNEILEGKIAAVIPELNAETRSVRVRISLPNKNNLLRPGMFARVHLNDEINTKPSLLIPSEAVISTGMRTVAILQQENGQFSAAEIKIGREKNGKSEVLEGLTAGEQIVVSGQFMIDSEASLRGLMARMLPKDGEQQANLSKPIYATKGTVKTIEKGEITIIHEAIPAIQWPAMTMPFIVKNQELSKDLKVGEAVQFSISQEGDDWAIESIQAIQSAENGAKK